MEGVRGLKVYQKAFKMAMEIFKTSRSFPKEEVYSLTDQIRRSSRSICANLSEGYRKKLYPKHFIAKISDADMECNETQTWLDFALACNYLTKQKHTELSKQCSEVGRILGSIIRNPRPFLK